MSLVVKLAWGLGDVLLTTSAIRRYKDLRPLVPIIFQTYTHNRTDRYHVQYEKGCPGEMLWHNPDIDQIIDVGEPHPTPATVVEMRYAWFGGPSLDYPIQAHYWDNLGLEWGPGQRFDSHFYLTDDERDWASKTLHNGMRTLAIAPACGWPGKEWRRDRWADLIRWATGEAYEVAVLAGERLTGPPWDQRGVLNLTSKLDMRQTAAILDAAQQAVLIEGGLSNLRFALGRPTILLTCATQVGVQIWTPPELTTETRMWQAQAGPRPGFAPWPETACEPCMWRGEHPKKHTRNVPPASLEACPPGRSLRDVPAEIIIEALQKER
jgi:hypothetical protein